jgi:hypothetical protein
MTAAIAFAQQHSDAEEVSSVALATDAIGFPVSDDEAVPEINWYEALLDSILQHHSLDQILFSSLAEYAQETLQYRVELIGQANFNVFNNKDALGDIYDYLLFKNTDRLDICNALIDYLDTAKIINSNSETIHSYLSIPLSVKPTVKSILSYFEKNGSYQSEIQQRIFMTGLMLDFYFMLGFRNLQNYHNSSFDLIISGMIKGALMEHNYLVHALTGINVAHDETDFILKTHYIDPADL